ncbi:MAG: penicillin-binding protein activator, partial [Gammaproteobacteria bacterium]
DLSDEQGYYLNLLRAQISLGSGDAEGALTLLDTVSPERLSASNRTAYHESKSFAYSLTGNLLESARERTRLGLLLEDPEKIQKNNAAILETLKLVSEESLNSAKTPSPDIFGGWVSLSLILRHKGGADASSFNEAIDSWRNEFPLHPAQSRFLPNYLSAPRTDVKTPAAVALLLPESGPFAQAAKAVREGFMAAHRRQASFQPPVRFYDTESSDIPLLYQRAISEGAELVVGPLDKTHIEQLAALPALTVPVLALNQVENLSKANLFQFGLNPEDEAQQAAEKALADGHRNSVVLVPKSQLGQRIADRFGDSWRRQGGSVLEARTYNPNQSDFSHPIQQLLNLDESNSRYRQIRRLLPSVKFTPRRRDDIDAIFIAGRPREARLLNPQLRFYRATGVPVYATPHVYEGLPNPPLDIDLNGVTFCDAPWLFGDIYGGELSLQALQSEWRQFPSVYLRLFALGIDANNLVLHLGQLADGPYDGATGRLRLAEDNRIKRTLVCARFENGTPRALGFNERSAAEDFSGRPD